MFLLRSLKKEVASPKLPTLPVLPILWTYSSMSLGRSKLTTCLTLEMSRPRAATCEMGEKGREKGRERESE